MRDACCCTEYHMNSDCLIQIDILYVSNVFERWVYTFTKSGTFYINTNYMELYNSHEQSEQFNFYGTS